MRPPRATVAQAQRTFRDLGYPLGTESSGELGVRTKGALSYFQREYGLRVTGYPDARTLAVMRAVATSLRSPTSRRGPPARDAVSRLLGGTPTFALAAGLAGTLALLALGAARGRRALSDGRSL